MNERYRTRTIRVDRDIIEQQLRARIDDECVYVAGGGDPCPDAWPGQIGDYCAPCFARAVLALSETEDPFQTPMPVEVPAVDPVEVPV